MTQGKIINFVQKLETFKVCPHPEAKILSTPSPSSCAQHIFRASVLTWILLKFLNIKANLEKVLKMVLIHDLAHEDFTEIRKSIDFLGEDLKAEIKSLIEEFQSQETLESQIVLSGSFLESYFELLEKENKKSLNKERILKEAKGKIKLESFYNFLNKALAEEKPKDDLLRFILEIGKLKNLPRRGWVIRNIPDSETVADHTFSVAILSWILSNSQEINIKKALKMALIHEICAVYAGDYTPHDIFSRGILSFIKELKQRPRMDIKNKQKLFLASYKKETQSLRKLINRLPINIQSEILSLWVDFVEKKSREANFVDQVNSIATYFQALKYWQKYKDFPISIFVESVAHFVSDEKLLNFVEDLNNIASLTKI